jgi:hypothetical protein
MFGQTWHRNLIASLLLTFVLVLMISGTTVVGLRKGMKRGQESWDSFELVVGEDFVRRSKRDFPDLEIRRHEVTRIKENATGLYVETKLRDRAIGIPRALIDYRDARELSCWIPLVHAEPLGWPSITLLLVIPVIGFVLFALLLLSTNSWVVIATGSLLLIWLSVSIWVIRRSVQTSAHMKRLTLFTVIPLLAVIARLIQAIQRLR